MIPKSRIFSLSKGLPGGAHWFELEGPDARDYLHRLTTVDFKNLDIGQGKPGFFLSAQGKVRAHFYAWALGAHHFGFEVIGGRDGRWIQAFKDTVDQTHFAEKMTLRASEESLQNLWYFSEHAPELPEGCLAFQHDHTFSIWGPEEQLRELPSLQELSLGEFYHYLLTERIAWADTEIDENLIPLEAGLTDRLADQKGCYPGQEVIERIYSLGSPSRRWSEVKFESPPDFTSATLFNSADAPQEIGVLTRFEPGSTHALGFVKKLHAKEGQRVSLRPQGAPEIQGEIVWVAPFKRESA